MVFGLVLTLASHRCRPELGPLSPSGCCENRNRPLLLPAAWALWALGPLGPPERLRPLFFWVQSLCFKELFEFCGCFGSKMEGDPHGIRVDPPVF